MISSSFLLSATRRRQRTSHNWVPPRLASLQSQLPKSIKSCLIKNLVKIKRVGEKVKAQETPHWTCLATFFSFLLVESLCTDAAFNCRYMEMTTNPLPNFSLTAFSFRSNDQNPAILYVKSSTTTLINRNPPSHSASLAILLIPFGDNAPIAMIKWAPHAVAYKGNQRYQSKTNKKKGKGKENTRQIDEVRQSRLKQSEKRKKENKNCGSVRQYQDHRIGQLKTKQRGKPLIESTT